jgi:hypothetical protein
MSVGVFFPRCWCDRASNTPVVILSSFTLRLSRFRESCFVAVRPLLEGWYGSEDVENHQDRCLRAPVKELTTFRPGMPSIDRDSS